MELDIFGDGSQYISASRASEISGYSSDYIGQLARKKKIPAKLIGRTWYVDEEALSIHKKTRQLGKAKKIETIRVSAPVVEEKPVRPDPAAKAAASLSPLNNFSLKYEKEEGIHLPDLSRKNIQTWDDNFVHKAVVATLSLIFVISATTSVLNFASPEMSELLERNISSLSHAPSRILSSVPSPNLASPLDAFLAAFKELKKIALKQFQPTTDSQRPTNQLTTNDKQLTAQVAITASAPNESGASYGASSQAIINLRGELESYINARISSFKEPVVVYQTLPVQTKILREEILLADTRPTITRQSDSDADRRSVIANNILDSGSFTTPTITGGTISGATISGSTFSGAVTLDNLLLNGSTTLQNFTFNNATGTSATTTNFFSTTASSTNLFFTTSTGGSLCLSGTCNTSWPSTFDFTAASYGVSTSTTIGLLNGFLSTASSTIDSAFLVTGSTTLQNFTFSTATGTSATTTNFFSTTASSTNLFSSLLTVGGNNLLVNSSGNTGVGTSTPFAKLTVHANNGETNATLFSVSSSTASTYKSLFSIANDGITTLGDSSGTGDANVQFASDSNSWALGYYSTDKTFRIASSTNLATNAMFQIGKSGTTTLNSGLGTGTGGNYLCINTSTYEILRGNGSSCTASSLRFKENVSDLTYGLEEVMRLRPVTFTYRAEMNSGTSTHLGFIAEEVELVVPELVSYDDGVIQGLDYPVVTSLLTKAIQELNLNLENIASSTATSTPESQSFATNFFENLFNRITTWLADAANGITRLFARELHTDMLCVKKSDGSEVCVNGDEIAALLSGSSATISYPTPYSTPASTIDTATTTESEVSTDTATTTTETINTESAATSETTTEPVVEATATSTASI